MKGILTPHVTEPVTLMVAGDVANPYGETAKGYTLGDTLIALVAPLGDALTLKYGMTGDRERLRVQLPALTVNTADRLRYRGRDWQVVNAERWQGFTVLIVEGIDAPPPSVFNPALIDSGRY